MLKKLLKKAVASTDVTFGLPEEICNDLATVTNNACNNSNKAVLAVLLTLACKKQESPGQDIRIHQKRMSGGFSGRGLDSKTVTPFLAREKFPSMKGGSGWLTPSLEQTHPYNFQYPGNISPNDLKTSFLRVVDAIQGGRAKPKACILFMLKRLLDWRSENAELEIAKPMGKRISEVVSLVERHWSGDGSGYSKIPTLAMYAVYRCLVREMDRYKNCELLPLLSHTSADEKTNRIGDVDVLDDNGTVFESVEVKHRIPITSSMVEGASEKIMGAGLKTFYIVVR